MRCSRASGMRSYISPFWTANGCAARKSRNLWRIRSPEQHRFAGCLSVKMRHVLAGAAESEVAQQIGTAREVFLAFLKLGLTSFGGPVAHLGFFRSEFVE